MKNTLISTKEIGDLGEDIACRFLIKNNFQIITRNFWKKWGEIDVVAKKDGKIHFVEVKSVTRENLDCKNFSRVTTKEQYRPEENVHPRKLKRMRRVIQSYLIGKNIKEGGWVFDVLTVEIDMKNKVARCRILKDIVL